jgi:hypothetical protein
MPSPLGHFQSEPIRTCRFRRLDETMVPLKSGSTVSHRAYLNELSRTFWLPNRSPEKIVALRRIIHNTLNRTHFLSDACRSPPMGQKSGEAATWNEEETSNVSRTTRRPAWQCPRLRWRPPGATRDRAFGQLRRRSTGAKEGEKNPDLRWSAF